MTCRYCTSVPKSDYTNIIVYMSAPAEHLETKIKHALGTLKYHFKDAGPYIIVDTPNFELLVSELDEGEFFNELETTAIQLLPTDAGEFFDFALLTTTRPLSYWRSLYDHKELLDILGHQRLVTLFQPIVKADSLERYGYEALSRGLRLDGRYLSAFDLFEGAKALHLTAHLDRLCRESAIRHAAKQQIHNHLFINFIPDAIFDPDACLQTTLEAVATAQLDASKIVFEAVNTEDSPDQSHIRSILNFYKNKGYKTALDDVGRNYTNFESYHALDTHYIKIDTSVVRNIHHRPEHQALLEKLLPLKSQYGAVLVAEGIEREEEYSYLKNKGIDLMQGYYFGKPELDILQK